MADLNRSRPRIVPWLLAAIAVSLLGVAWLASIVIVRDSVNADHSQSTPSGQLEYLTALRDVAIDPSGAPARFPVHIRRPDGPPRIELTEPDPQGRTGSIACSTCHSVREPNFQTKLPADLDQFHQGMPFNHGQLTCYACHHPNDADSLRLADSQPVSYPDVMVLCAQCHGVQMRDYEHGAHGGMTGYWDLTRGPRTRNNCIDCHDPHVPAFPKMQPVFKPQDRFLEPSAHDAAAHDTSGPGDVDHVQMHRAEAP